MSINASNDIKYFLNKAASAIDSGDFEKAKSYIKKGMVMTNSLVKFRLVRGSIRPN
jgi:hypothetical protein